MENPEIKPLSKEERDRLEGVTPEAKEALKRGLQTPWKETLEELELKAQDILPEKPLETHEAKKEKWEEQRDVPTLTFEKLSKEYGGLRAMFDREMERFQNFIEKHQEVYKNEFLYNLLKASTHLGSVRNTLADLYNLPEGHALETQITFLERYNEIMRTQIVILRELDFQARRIIEEK